MTVNDCRMVIVLGPCVPIPCVALPLEGMEAGMPHISFSYFLLLQVSTLIVPIFLKLTLILSNVIVGGCKVFIHRQSRHDTSKNLPLTVPSRSDKRLRTRLFLVPHFHVEKNLQASPNRLL